MRAVIYLTILLMLCCTIAEAASVHVKDGNIFYDNNGESIQLTSSGRDEDPILHPKGEWVYFVRSFEGKFIGEKYYPPKEAKSNDGLLKQELWRVKIDGTNAVMLFRSEHAAIDRSGL